MASEHQAAKGTSLAKVYYDADDSQLFYSKIWGDDTHVGRYDLLTEEDKQQGLQEQIFKAQVYHEEEFIRLIHSKFPNNTKVKVLDMGCGYGGLLRRLWQAGVVRSGSVGCDISSKMCEKARQLNGELGCDKDITINEESYLEVQSVQDASKDLVISMDALLHVGPEGQRAATKEAARVVRPGGWMIFSDIMQQEDVDPKEMQPMYDRIHLSKMGTISNYKQVMEEAGFTNFEALPNASTNVSAHYGTVCKVLDEKGDSFGITREFQERMKAGLYTWRDLGEKNIVWGFILAQKKA